LIVGSAFLAKAIAPESLEKPRENACFAAVSQRAQEALSEGLKPLVNH